MRVPGNPPIHEPVIDDRNMVTEPWRQYFQSVRNFAEWNGRVNTEYTDAGSAAATEQAWIEVEVDGAPGYIRVYAAK